MKNIVIAVLLLLLGAGGAFLYLRASRPQPGERDAKQEGFCSKHGIDEKDCPWCDPTLIKKKGQCVEHGVAEALCSKCNPALIAGFKAENDWCAGHNIPESQCTLCKAGNLPPGETR